jgi:hypothetical protein
VPVQALPSHDGPVWFLAAGLAMASSSLIFLVQLPLFDSHVPFEPGWIRIVFDRMYQMDTVTLLLEYGDVTSPLLLLAFQWAVGRHWLGH